MPNTIPDKKTKRKSTMRFNPNAKLDPEQISKAMPMFQWFMSAVELSPNKKPKYSEPPMGKPKKKKKFSAAAKRRLG